MGDLQHHTVGFVDWNIALEVKNCTSTTQWCVSGPNHADPQGDDAPIAVDSVRQRIYTQPSYYFIGHFSRYVLPQSIRIGAAWSDSARPEHVQAVAFARPPPHNDHVAVVMNSGNATVNYALQVTQPAVEHVTLSAPPRSIVTLIW